MLLAIDIGNTNIVWGVFDGAKLLADWRVSTDHSKTTDEYAILLLDLLRVKEISPDRVAGVGLSGVVPPLTAGFGGPSDAYLPCPPLIMSHELESGLTIKSLNPREVGSDRIVNAAAAYRRYGGPIIIVDFGTATTFCAVTAAGEYLGGAIAPGLRISAEALFNRAAKLPKIELIRPKTAIGQDTVTSMQSGLIFGYAGLVDELVRRIQQELGQDCFVVATGGLAGLIAPESRTIREVRPHLTLEGLALLHAMNRPS
ncbi:MAG: type III pantothenate kinase [Nitrospirae bacterium]|nr:MAG: type III pantothenate kinase [Nitrospirota bacterium]